MRNVSALHWHDKRIKYFFTNYDQSLIVELIKMVKTRRQLLAMGLSYAKELLLRGYDIYGVDWSDVSPVKLIDVINIITQDQDSS